MLNCKHATKLISDEQDRPLSLKDRAALRVHLMMCSGCNNYKKQMELIRRACRRIGGVDSGSDK
ncbi:MAG: zf-HC2 domain-containing protein [Gammaproteobacteria bacterium]|nr:zf-HC2 domain-containing protein [Gammaproteobacteria bacterium]